MKVSFSEQADPRPVYRGGGLEAWPTCCAFELPSGWPAAPGDEEAAVPSGAAAGASSVRAWHCCAGRRPRTCHTACWATGALLLIPESVGKYLRAHPLGPERW